DLLQAKVLHRRSSGRAGGENPLFRGSHCAVSFLLIFVTPTVRVRRLSPLPLFVPEDDVPILCAHAVSRRRSALPRGSSRPPPRVSPCSGIVCGPAPVRYSGRVSNP